jgi:hypothetical protein
MNRVRIINDKGQIKYVAKHIAENEKLLKQYGFTKQDLNEGKKEDGVIDKWIEVVKKEMENGDILMQTEIKGGVFLEPNTDTEGVLVANEVISEQPITITEEQARAKYFEVFGKKAGNKKLLNILKEIEEKTNR